MTDTTVSSFDRDEVSSPATARSGLRGFLRYTLVRGVIISITVVIAVWVTILIANYGGYVDEIIRSNIAQAFMFGGLTGAYDDIPAEERPAAIEAMIAQAEDAAGLNDPFLLRTLWWLGDGLTLDWGETSARRYGVTTGRVEVRSVILDNLSRSLLIFGSSNVVLFFATIFLALILTRNYGSVFDKVFAYLSPLSAAPAWVYGVIISVVLLRFFGFSTQGTLDNIPADADIAYLPIFLRHLFPPFLAIVLSGLFQGVYAWRTFFLVYSSEDYVDLARAKGLNSRMIERRYILRPALPAILTSFALLAMGLWQEIIALEYFFNVQGIGRVFLAAIQGIDTPMIVGLVVTFAYLLALTVFILDIVYSLVDPRIRVGGNNNESGSVVERKRPWWRFWEYRPAFLRRSRTPKPQADRKKAAAEATETERSLADSLSDAGVGATRWFSSLGGTLRQLNRYPSAIVGLVIIFALLAVSIYTIFAVPYDEAIAMWRGEGNVWVRNPKAALPVWVNAFRVNDLPETLILDSHDDGDVTKTREVISEDITEVNLTYPISYDYGGFPQELSIFFDAQFAEKAPHVTVYWLTPDGREIELTTLSPTATQVYHFTQDQRLQRRLDNNIVREALFLDPAAPADDKQILEGDYQLRINALLFEDESDVEAEFVLFGQVHGLAGTDQNRRDLTVALLWGTPVALAFGIVAAVVTSVSGMLFAALGAWYGGWIDRVIQFLTEVNIILPFFPVALMIFTLYSKDILVILAVVVALSIFGTSVKTYRAVFLQVKQEPYIEAAQTYGASSRRIVLRYLIPRIVAILVPRLVILVPGYVFLEATLAFLGVSDPVLPTWGKLMTVALGSTIYSDNYHLVLIPLALLLLTGFGFALVGLALEKVFEPKLREI